LGTPHTHRSAPKGAAGAAAAMAIGREESAVWKMGVHPPATNKKPNKTGLSLIHITFIMASFKLQQK